MKGGGVRVAMPRRKYGHLRVNIGPKANDRFARPGCPKCARGDCAQHLR